MILRLLKTGFLVLLLYSVTFAQKGRIRGRVYNRETNEPMAFVNVVVLDTETGAASDIDGNFLITGLEPGFYRLMASFIGYEISYSDEVQVNNAKTAYVEIPMDQTTIGLEEVVVRPSTFERIEESPLSLQRIQVSDIEKSPGANRDISRVIQSFPGVGSSVSFRNDVIVRGGGPSENSFYLDGIEIPNLNHFATQGASGGPVGIINPDFIQTVNYYSGAFPANRGDALSAVFEFKQKSGNKDRTNRRAVVGASEIALTLDGPLFNNTSYLFSVRRSYLQFLFSAIGLPFLPTFSDYQLKTETEFDPKNKLVIVSLGALDNSRLNTGIENPDKEQQYILNYLPEQDQWNYMIGAKYTHFRGKSFQTYVLSRNMLNNESYKYQDNDDSSEENLILDYQSREIENKFRFENTYRYQDYKFNMGFDLEYAKYSNETLEKVFQANTLQELNYSSGLKFYLWGLFGQVSRPFLNDRLSLSFGIRSDANNYAASMRKLRTQLSPRFSAAYTLFKNFSLNLNTGRYYQLPSYTTLGYRDNSGTLVNKTNKIRYIAVDHFITGVEYIMGINSRIAVEGFYKTYQDYPFSVTDSIALANKGGDFGVVGDEEVVSTGEGRAYGLEISGRSQLPFDINTILAYTLVRSEFADADGQLIPSSWDSQHILNLTLTKAFDSKWQIGSKIRYVGGLPYTPYDLDKSARVVAWNTQGRPFLDYSRYNSKRLQPFFQLDVRIDREFDFENWSFLIYLDIQNALNYKAELPDIIIPATDENGQRIISNPAAVPSDQRYLLERISYTTGTLLPTIGITVDW